MKFNAVVLKRNDVYLLKLFINDILKIIILRARKKEKSKYEKVKFISFNLAYKTIYCKIVVVVCDIQASIKHTIYLSELYLTYFLIYF
jgi:hypothetical protein